MLRIFFYSLIFTAAVLLGIFMNKTPGYVLLAYSHWTLETSLWAFIALLLICFLVLHFILCFSGLIKYLFLRFRCWRRKSTWQKTRSLTEQGLLALAECSWRQAIKKLLRGAKRESKPLINYLGAAFAAQQQKRFSERDAYFKKARFHAPKQDIPISLIEARFLRESNQLELACAILKRLYSIVPKHPEVLKELAEVYQAQNDWHHVLELIPSLKRYAALPTKASDALTQEAYTHLLEQAHGNCELLQTIWNQIPKKLMTENHIRIYAQALIDIHEYDRAQNEVQAALDRKWNDVLGTLYFSIENLDSKIKLQTCKRWLKKYKHSAFIYLYAGKFAMNLKNWDLAEEYLTESLALQPTSKCYCTLAELYEHQDEIEKALEMYRIATQIL